MATKNYIPEKYVIPLSPSASIQTEIIYKRHGIPAIFLKCEKQRELITCFMELNIPAAKKTSVCRQTRRMCCFENVMLTLINQPIQHLLIKRSSNKIHPASPPPTQKKVVPQKTKPSKDRTRVLLNIFIKRMKSEFLMGD